MKASRRIKSKTSSWTYLLIAVVVFITGAIASYFYFKPRLTFEIPFIEDIESQGLETKHPVERDKTGDKGLSIEEDKEPIKDALLVTVENMIRKYMKPYDVKLSDIYRDNEGIIYIDLSSELKKNFKGDAMEEYSIIAGLYKGIKEKIPDFTAMKILIEGKEVDSFGGHINISEPIDVSVLSIES